MSVLDDMLTLSRNMGVASGRWEQNDALRPEFVLKQIVSIIYMADKYHFQLTFDETLADEDSGEVISQSDFWDLNITVDNYASADMISFGMYEDLENFLRKKLYSEILNL